MSYELKPRTEAGEKFVEATECVITNLRNRALISDQNSSIDEDNFFIPKSVYKNDLKSSIILFSPRYIFELIVVVFIISCGNEDETTTKDLVDQPIDEARDLIKDPISEANTSVAVPVISQARDIVIAPITEARDIIAVPITEAQDAINQLLPTPSPQV